MEKPHDKNALNLYVYNVLLIVACFQGALFYYFFNAVLFALIGLL